MAIDEADQSDAGQFSGDEASDSVSEDQQSHEPDAGSDVRVGEYTWAEFMEEHGHGDEVSDLYPDDSPGTGDQLGLDTDETVEPTVPSGDDWNDVSFDPAAYLGFHPDDLEAQRLPIAGDNRDVLEEAFLEYVDPETTPVVKDVWTWEHYKWEYYYEDDGSRPRDGDGEIVRHDEEEALGFDPDTLEERLAIGDDIAMELDEVVEERTVNVQEDFDEDEFFSTAAGNTTVTNRYDLEKAVPMEKKTHFQEIERYWVNKPYACVVIFHSEKENEKKYYMIEPYLNEIETELQEFLSGKLRTAIKYSDEGIKEKASEDGRRAVIEDETQRLLKRYDLFENTSGSKQAGLLETITSLLDDEEAGEETGPSQLEGIEVRPEPAVLADDPDTLNEYQVEKLLHLLKRNFIGYERIDGIKHDINVEDISCDGYNSPVFVYHSEYEQIISNIYHGEDELDDFVVKLAQRSGKGISKRLPQVDATLPDGSRAQLTLGEEVSDHGTNYTIRQFKDVPFTPVDLINWNTFSLDEMAFLWLAIENHKSLIFAGGTASGKTTSLNAVSLFIPSSSKIVSIEDTREVELPQRNWIASVTRPSFSDDEQGDVDEFDLLEAALRQRPDYIVMGEIRGEEGRTLFQVMSTGHTTYTTFHADSVDEVLKRFTTDPINVSKTMFTALDLVSIQTQTRVQGRKVRRNKSLTEINHYEAEHDEINVQDVYQWQAETDEYLKMGDSNTLEEIQFDRGWNNEKLEEELFKREVILAYLIKNDLNTYAEVAATVQAFINDPETILTLIANGQLEESLDDLREMESVLIDVDQEKEELVPRPESTTETYNLSTDILERAEESLFEEYRGKTPSGVASALGDVEEERTIEVDGADSAVFDFSDATDEWELGDDSTAFDGVADDSDAPSWLEEDTGFDIGGDAEPDGAEPPVPADAPAAGGSGADPNQATATDSGADPNQVTAAESDAGTEPTTGGRDTDAEVAPVGIDTAEPSADPADSTAGQSVAGQSIASTSGVGNQDGNRGESNDAGEGIGGLFDDMDDTLEEIDDAEERPGGTDVQDGSDEADIGSAPPDDGPGSIFDPDAADGTSTGDFSDVFTSSGETSPWSADGSESSSPDGAADSPTGATETETKRAETPSDDRQTATPADEQRTGELSSDPGDSAVAEDDASAGSDSSASEPEPPTIDLGESPADGSESEPADDERADGSPEPPTIDVGEGPDEETGDVDGASAGDEADGDPPTGTDDTDSSANASPGESDVDPETEASSANADADEGESTSIFDEDAASIFGDDDDETSDADDGSLFDSGDDADGGESIFTGDESGDERADGSDEETDT